MNFCSNTTSSIFVIPDVYIHEVQVHYLSISFSVWRDGERGRQCAEAAKQALQYFNSHAINMLCYYPIVLLMVLNSLKAKEEFLYLITEGTA